ncbi:centrosome-associated protein 350 isoform X2 [Gouania willdenowi]|uniref:centrosome-associated protein 350 isoform X2 n=1 Tax=Gouania willdenowi TaxID=441366 RepID=UPI001056263B|nr:centrosome-associated protein 350 isoform X2 [Gouania willdenowi]
MRSSRRTESPHKSSAQQLTDLNTGSDLTSAWKSFSQSKAALRHIENHIAVTSGTGVCLDTVIDPLKKKSSKTVHGRDGRQAADLRKVSNPRSRSQQSPENGNSRSPLSNTTQDSNVRKNNNVEFREPLATYREASPSPHPSSQLEAYSLPSVPKSSYSSSLPTQNSPFSELVYTRDTRDRQTDMDLDSTHSSALESTNVHYLNDQHAVDSVRPEENTPKAQFSSEGPAFNSCITGSPSTVQRGDSTPSTSPGSASQRLENLRRHQPDNKLEKLKECIRKQRQHLEEAAEKEKLLGFLDRPIKASTESNGFATNERPPAKVRKVAAAPPAPIYKGFNSTETNIRTPDGKVWKREEFHKLNRQIYRELSQQLAESTRIRHQRDPRADGAKERVSAKPVRKVHKAVNSSDHSAKQVITPASWRDGQKLVHMVLGPGPKLSKEEEGPTPTERPSRTGSRSESKNQSRPTSKERTRAAFQGKTKINSFVKTVPSSTAQDTTSESPTTKLLSADIQGILDDLQLDCKAAEKQERSRTRSRDASVGRRGRGGSVSQTRTPVSTWATAVAATNSSRVCRSASPMANQSEMTTAIESSNKKRHYDADTVRQYIARQQDERKRRQVQEKKAMREEADRRNQRLQELYRKQREAAKSEVPVHPVQKRLRETYTKLLNETEDIRSHGSVSHSNMRPIYQPSGESDKENKRLEAPQSPSSSDRSLNEQLPPPLSRTDLDFGMESLREPAQLSTVVQPVTDLHPPTNEHVLSQILRLERAMAASNIKHTQRPATSPFNKSRSKMSRIEALKATAASLSNRIESEARKLAGEGINYGLPTSMDVDATMAPETCDLNLPDWAEMATRATEGNNDIALRMQRISNCTGQNLYDPMVLPGAGCLSFREQKEKTGAHASLINNPTYEVDALLPILCNNTQESRYLVNGINTTGKEERTSKLDLGTNWGLEKNASNFHDSSAGSISEGPLLSEGSISGDERSPVHPCNSYTHGVAGGLEEMNHSSSRKKDHQRLQNFEREAAVCSPFGQRACSKAGWEEMNKGTPLSVINIFTKNFQGHTDAYSSPFDQSMHSGSAAVYEDDFVSSSSSRASDQIKRSSNSPSSTCGSSPLSRHSTKKRGTASNQSDGTLIEGQRSSCSPESTDSGNRGNRSFARNQSKSVQIGDTFKETAETTHQRLRKASPSGSPQIDSSPVDSPSESVRGVSRDASGAPNTNPSSHGRRAEMPSSAGLQYSPAVLQQRMAAELQYLGSMEDSVRQLGDIERLLAVSVSQQESMSLTQMLKANQERHERDLYELKIKAEREALEMQLQLEENKQRVARAHIEMQENLAATQRDTLEGLQESATKMMTQQAEAARYTADAARHIKEMTELALTQMTGTLSGPPLAIGPSTSEKVEEEKNATKHQDSDSFHSEASVRRAKLEEPQSSPHSLSHSDSLSFKRPNISEGTSSSNHSPSSAASDYSKEVLEGKRGGTEGRPMRHAVSSSIEERVAPAANGSLCSDSVPSVLDERRDSTSIATEYSLKFDESMTEDDIEEHSFRSLLPSEAHRRGTMEKKSRHHYESEEDGANPNTTLIPGSHSTLKTQEANIVFSGGQDSFSQFTMDMVRQYMKDEEVRLQHQSALLRLRQKALKEKTRTELAWLEHQKKNLRDKGEDDKMPPIRKKQRGLLIKLQQEQAEIRRLQEANKAARKERQILLKQQEEIERMRNSTLRLKERLKCAGGEAPPESPVSELAGSEAISSHSKDADNRRSPSPPLSVSGSETSSIMQKLKKMRSHNDEKHCSPVHYFFSVFTAQHWASLSFCLPNLHPKFQLFIYKQLVRFLTKREQQLMQRRLHAEELLQWKQRLDKEEAEVRRMEKEALTVWDRRTSQNKDLDMSNKKTKEISYASPQSIQHPSSEPRTDSERDDVSEEKSSSVRSDSSIHTEGLPSQQLESPSLAPPSSVPGTPLISILSSPATYTPDFTSVSQSPEIQSSPLKGSHSPAASPSYGSSRTKMQLCTNSLTPNEAFIQPSVVVHSETISDQSDIESRIQALKEELRKRKSMAQLLKKEQKKRNKERLKAQEASLLKQLENYNNFIEKTKAELDKETESSSDTKPLIKDPSLIPEPSNGQPKYRSEGKGSDSGWAGVAVTVDHGASPRQDHSRSSSVPKDVSLEKSLTPTITAYDNQEGTIPPLSGRGSVESSLRSSIKDGKAGSNEVSDVSVDVPEELESNNINHESVISTEKGDKPHSQETLKNDEEQHPPSIFPEANNQSMHKETSEDKDVLKAKDDISKQSHSAVVHLETLRPSSSDHFHESGTLSSHQVDNVVEPDGIADSYVEDFESSVDFTPREDYHTSNAESDIRDSKKGSHSRASPSSSQDEVIEEEIPEELSDHSATSERTQQSGRLFDLDKQKDELKLDNKSDSPSISPEQTTQSQLIVEMPDFNIGDRVLVGGVQPGTLKFKGPTSFANGFWAGVELDKSEGSNNGTYDGVVYFICKESHGIFAPPDKITHLPDKFELFTDTTEDEDSFFDDLGDKEENKHTNNNDMSGSHRDLNSEDERPSFKTTEFGVKSVDNQSLHRDPPPLKITSYLSSLHQKDSELPVSNGNAEDFILNLKDAAQTVHISDMDKDGLELQSKKVTPPKDRGDFRPREDGRTLADAFTNTLINNFLKDTVATLIEIKKTKKQNIEEANQMNEDFFSQPAEEEEKWIPSVDQKDDLPFFLPAEKVDLLSPELCNRPESPVFGASGQEELAKRLAELELSRELLDDLGDDQDWFDEDFGLSSRREQQRLKKEEARLSGGRGDVGSSAMGGTVSSAGVEQQVKIPPRPELPLPLPPKLPEQPAMVVPHSAAEVEKMVFAATQQIWESCDLGKQGAMTLYQMSRPKPSQVYLGEVPSNEDLEALSIHSYRKAVFDLTWEMLEDMYAEDPNSDQPLWIKPRRVKSSAFHRVKAPGDMTRVQEFVAAEVLKLYGLADDQSQKNDWQKMLKFGRKKRDRVDHILVQELHEEEAQWVNYDEDELFVKMQLADSVFDALLKDTVNVLTQISDKRANRDNLT